MLYCIENYKLYTLTINLASDINFKKFEKHTLNFIINVVLLKIFLGQVANANQALAKWFMGYFLPK